MAIHLVGHTNGEKSTIVGREIYDLIKILKKSDFKGLSENDCKGVSKIIKTIKESKKDPFEVYSEICTKGRHYVILARSMYIARDHIPEDIFPREIVPLWTDDSVSFLVASDNNGVQILKLDNENKNKTITLNNKSYTVIHLSTAESEQTEYSSVNFENSCSVM